MYKKMTSHGSVSIPVALRRDLGLQPKDPVEVTTDQSGNIVLKPYLPRCTFCGRQEEVKRIYGRYVCTGCVRKICELLEKGEETDG
mgnify:FL=1